MNNSQTSKILRLLKAQGRATSQELNKICYRYSARIHDLRKEGHVIVTNRIKQGVYEFVYRGER